VTGGLGTPVLLAAVAFWLALTAWFRRADPFALHVERICKAPTRRVDDRASRIRAAVRRALTSGIASRPQRRRRDEVDGQALDFVELLLAATVAGLPPATAVERAAAMTSGVLGEELDVAAAKIEMGLGWRESLDQLVARTDSVALGRLTRSLARAHRLGTSPRQSLRSIADELRLERRSKAEELARRAPVKMLFPLVLLVLPAFLLLTVGPVLLATIRSLQ